MPEFRQTNDPLIRIGIFFGVLDRWLDDLRSKTNGKIAVVCRTDKRSTTAQASLRAAGFDGLTVLRGGMERWNAPGFKAVRDTGGATSTTPKEHPP